MGLVEKGYKQYKCPNPMCRASNCFEHCNHCGINIKWKNNLGDPFYETNKEGKRVRLAYELNDSVHRCMKKGTRDGKYYNKNEVNEYKLDEYRTIYRYRGPEFKCNLCNRVADLPVMLEHHKDNKNFDCNDKLMKQLFKEKPQHYIDTKNHRLDEFK